MIPPLAPNSPWLRTAIRVAGLMAILSHLHAQQTASQGVPGLNETPTEILPDQSANTVFASEEFQVAVLPDTQGYSQSFPANYSAQTQWIVNNAVARKIGFVTHLGDITNNHDQDYQWANAKSAMDILDNANMPWGAIPGNHDFLYGDGPDDFTGSRYLANFGPQNFTGKTWYKGHSPSKLSNYQVIDFGSATILFLHLNLETPVAELVWAQGVLNQNRHLPVWVSTHRYLQDAEAYTGGVPLVASGRYPDIWYALEPLYRPDGMKSEIFFNSFVRGNKNIFMVHCGHFHAEFRQNSSNNYGLTVHEILADYQDDPNGGDGWLRMCTFRPSQNQIFVETISPTFDGDNDINTISQRSGSESQFTLNVDLDQYTSVSGNQVVRFQNGIDGYTGTQDTWINSDAGGFFESDGPDRDTNYGNSTVLQVDNDWDNSPFGDDPTQSMIKFTNITQAPVLEGDPVPTKIPTNATITRAILSYNMIDDVDIGDEDMLVYRLNRDWDESTATWNSLGNGLSGAELVGPAINVDGDDNPDQQTVRNVAVTDFVRAWFGPSAVANNGFAILPENTPNNDDGMTLASSESSDIIFRPALDIEFTYPVGNRPPAVTNLASSSLNITEGQSIVLTLAASDANPNDPVLLKVNGADVSFGVGSASYNEVIVLEQNGSYLFAGEVNDDEATVSGGSLTVTVDNANPSITSLTGDLTVEVGETFAFSATATDPGVQDILTYTWDLDADGQYDDATGSSGSHSFSTPGERLVSLLVTDGDGGSATASFSVTVNDPYIAFAQQYGLTGGKNDDDDRDGFSNEIERILGTLPNDANDRLTLTIENINYNSASNLTEVNLRISELRPVGIYRLYWTDELSEPQENWTLIRTIDPAAPADDVPVEDELTGNRTMATAPRGFYQLRFEAASAP